MQLVNNVAEQCLNALLLDISVNSPSLTDEGIQLVTGIYQQEIMKPDHQSCFRLLFLSNKKEEGISGFLCILDQSDSHY